MKEEILKMAREAGLRSAVILHLYGGKEGALCDSEIEELAQIERFFHMAQAAERNKVASWMMAQGYATGHGDTVEDLLQELGPEIEAKIAAEREACAKVCEELFQVTPPYTTYAEAAQDCADAIRARGTNHG